MEANCATQDDFWAEATDPKRGLKYRVDNDTVWYRFRNRHFRGKRRRMPEDGRYGDLEELKSYSSAGKWKQLLHLLVQNHLAEETEDLKGVVLVNDTRGADFLSKLQLFTRTLQKIRGLQQKVFLV